MRRGENEQQDLCDFHQPTRRLYVQDGAIAYELNRHTYKSGHAYRENYKKG